MNLYYLKEDWTKFSADAYLKKKWKMLSLTVIHLPMADMPVLLKLVQRSYRPAYSGLIYGRMPTSLLKTAIGVNAPVIFQDAMKCLKEEY